MAPAVPSGAPRLYSGHDRTGVPWTVVYLPREFGEHLNRLSDVNRRRTLRRLLADFERTTGLAYGYQDA